MAVPRVLVGAMVACLLGGCSDDGNPPPADTGGGDSAANDGAGDTRVGEGGATSLTLTAYPSSLKGYPGGTALILAEARVQPSGASVTAKVTTQPSATVELSPASSPFPGVAEVMVKPTSGQVGSTVNVHISAQSGGLVEVKTVVLSVVGNVIEPEQTAAGLRDKFVSYLAQNKPSFNITSSTAWQKLGTVPEILVVAHFLYLSKEWEMGLSWHVMIAPNDWAQVYLRRRTEMKPSWAARIKSVSTDPTITETTPPQDVVR